MNKGIIFNIQKFCIHDGDGIRTCVFLKGCPLRCIWCHNPESLEKSRTLSFIKEKCSLCGKCLICSARESVEGKIVVDREKCINCGRCEEICPGNANEIIGKEADAAEVFAEVMKDKMFYDTSGGGLTVTGGEPSYQPEFTLELLTLAKESGISSAVETCGAGARDFYSEAADLGATFLFDVKCISPTLHKKLTGADNKHILSNLEYLMSRNADIIIRIPLVPDCNDSDEDIALLAEFLNQNKGRFRYAEIMPYHSLGTGKSDRIGKALAYSNESATEQQINRWRKLFESNGAKIK